MANSAAGDNAGDDKSDKSSNSPSSATAVERASSPKVEKATTANDRPASPRIRNRSRSPSFDRRRTRTRNAHGNRRSGRLEPDVVVIEEVPVPPKVKEVVMDPKKDLWVSTSDGRYESPVLPVRCGFEPVTFWVHRDILRRNKVFAKMIDGGFKEAYEQVIDLPDDDPAVISLMIAYLYEGNYVPIKPAADAIVELPSKGKGREVEVESESSSSSDSISGSDSSASDRRRMRRQTRRNESRTAEYNERNRKQPGRHRPGCFCASCINLNRAPNCANCGVRSPAHPRPPGYHPVPPQGPWMHDRPPQPAPPGAYPRPMPPPAHGTGPFRAPGIQFTEEPRMNAEDVKSWLMTYELSIDVYICAEKYLMDAFKQCVATYITDMLETAGNDAAVPPILHSCKRVYERMATKDDILVKKILARVGFMLPQLWKRYPAETQEFWMDNVEVGCMMMKETMARRELDVPGDLPPMDRWPTNLPPPPPMMREYSRERPRRHYPAY